jgi:hypothetical protein
MMSLNSWKSMAKSPARLGSTGKPQTIAKLQKLLANKQSDLAWHHEVGRLVDQIVPERTYNQAEIVRLAEQVGEGRDFVYKVLAFARLFRERDLPTLNGLTFGHVKALLGVKDAKLRDRLRQQCQQHEWTNRQLWIAVQELLGKRSQGGRPVNKPTKLGPLPALRTIVRDSKAWQRQCVPALERNLKSLAKRLKRQPDEELLQLVGETCTALSQLQAAAEQSLKRLKGIRAANKGSHRKGRGQGHVQERR